MKFNIKNPCLDISNQIFLSKIGLLKKTEKKVCFGIILLKWVVFAKKKQFLKLKTANICLSWVTRKKKPIILRVSLQDVLSLKVSKTEILGFTIEIHGKNRDF